MYLAKNNIIPSKEWEHDPELKDKYGNTVCYYLFNNRLQVPE